MDLGFSSTSQILNFYEEVPEEQRQFDYTGIRVFQDTPGTIFTNNQPINMCTYGDCIYIFSFWAKPVPKLKSPLLDNIPENWVDFDETPYEIKPRYSYGGHTGIVHNQDYTIEINGEEYTNSIPNWSTAEDICIISEYIEDTDIWNVIHSHGYWEGTTFGSPSDGKVNLGNEWKRISISFIPNPSVQNYVFEMNKQIYLNFNSGMQNCDEFGYNPGGGTEICKDMSIYIWGAQLEKRIRKTEESPIDIDEKYEPTNYMPKFGGDIRINYKEQEE